MTRSLFKFCGGPCDGEQRMMDLASHEFGDGEGVRLDAARLSLRSPQLGSQLRRHGAGGELRTAWGTAEAPCWSARSKGRSQRAALRQEGPSSGIGRTFAPTVIPSSLYAAARRKLTRVSSVGWFMSSWDTEERRALRASVRRFSERELGSPPARVGGRGLACRASCTDAPRRRACSASASRRRSAAAAARRSTRSSSPRSSSCPAGRPDWWRRCSRTASGCRTS